MWVILNTLPKQSSGLMVLCDLALFWSSSSTTTRLTAQNCFGGIESFEKTTGTAFGPSVGASVLLQQQDQALTRDCINLCKQQSQCLAFSLDYAGFRCGSYNVNSVGRRDALEVRLNNNYFEKTCFHGVQRSLFENLCGDRLWAFERVRDAFLNGYVEKEVQNVQTKEECERLCLTEVNFICRSADYDEVMRVCRLSKEDRRSQPQAFREVVGSNRDYLENQCAASARRNIGATAAQLSRYLYTATGTHVSKVTASKRLYERTLFARKPAVCVSLTSTNR
ncbi:uncharacterized protein TNCV_162611 [Trichonephila clavipes]|nr:uncharacterized protein TNCV_162611 [Trichonephila clavipes]